MNQVRALIETYNGPFEKARAVSQTTTTTFVSKVATATEPLGDAGTAAGSSIILVGKNRIGPAGQNAVLICPYGAGADNATFSLRVFGWKQAGDDVTGLWVPVLLAELLCTISTACPGLAGKIVTDSQYFCDTITVVGTSAPGSGIDIQSNANGQAAYVLLSMLGFPKIELTFITGSSADSCNALVTQM